MRIMFAAAALLSMSGAAIAYQSYGTSPSTSATSTASMDQSAALTPSSSWTAEQRALWEEWMTYHPGWTAEQRAAFDAAMDIPPASWTAEQRALFEQHLAHVPPDWTAAERAMFDQQLASMGLSLGGHEQHAGMTTTPAYSTTTTPAYSTTTTPVYSTTTPGTTLAMAPASGAIVQPSNANPERDARGIPVISDPAVVPAGFNGIGGAGMGGPAVDPATGETIDAADDSYPACTREITDNCIQTYEVGRPD